MQPSEMDSLSNSRLQTRTPNVQIYPHKKEDMVEKAKRDVVSFQKCEVLTVTQEICKNKTYVIFVFTNFCP